MPVRPRAEDPAADQARFVFKGTVQRLKAATMPGVAVDDRTVVVRVDQILQAPEGLSDYLGQDITVLLARPKKISLGQQAVFYANGGVFGDSVAVLALDHRAAKDVPGVIAMAAAVGDPAQRLADRDAHTRFAQADVVVSGRVRSVSLPAELAGSTFGMAAVESGASITKPISEHDPLVQEAVIEVAAVHKGTHRAGTVKVRFPNSRDVKWYRAPKFHAGQEGFFMLHRDEAKKSARAGIAVAAGVSADVADGVYTALHPADFQPFDEPGGIRHVISASTQPAVRPAAGRRRGRTR